VTKKNMEELKELLKQLLANQVVIYSRLQELEDEQHGRTRIRPDKDIVEELNNEAEKFIPFV
jgi:hypothetical protein